VYRNPHASTENFAEISGHQVSLYFESVNLIFSDFNVKICIPLKLHKRLEIEFTDLFARINSRIRNMGPVFQAGTPTLTCENDSWLITTDQSDIFCHLASRDGNVRRCSSFHIDDWFIVYRQVGSDLLTERSILSHYRLYHLLYPQMELQTKTFDWWKEAVNITGRETKLMFGYDNLINIPRWIGHLSI